MPIRSIRIVVGVSLCLAACGPPAAVDCPSPAAVASGPWARTYGGPRPDVASAIAAAADGTLVLGGSTRSFDAVDADLWLLRLGRDGEVVWEERFEGPATERAAGVVALRDGGAVVVADWSVSTGLSRRSAILVARLDCTGDVVWATAVESAEGVLFAEDVREAPEGGFLVAGAIGEPSRVDLDCLVVKLAANGSPQWRQVYGRADGNESCHSIALADDGFVLAGEYESPESPRRWSDVWLVRIDAQGAVRWQETFGEPDSWERAPAIREVGGGTFLVSAMRDEGAELIAVDGSGTAVWQRAYRVPQGLLFPSGVSVSPDGAAIVVGTTRPPDGSLEDVWAMRASASGDVVWSRRYGRDTLDRGEAVTGHTVEDGVVLAATMAWGSPEDADDAFLLRLGSDGRAGTQGDALAIVDERLGTAPWATAAPVRVTPLDVSSPTLRVERTQASVRSLP
jgi:hypothetical protein